MAEHKTLYMVRHAKSSWSSMDSIDFDRPLNNRGFRDAPEMGRRLRARKPIPEIILCSPAKRARQTLKEMDLGVGNIAFEEGIYCASRDELLELIRSIPNQYDSAMIIGHNPAMTWLAAHITGASIDNLPTCAVVTSNLDCSLWAKAGSCNGRLVDYDYPRKPV